MFPSALHSSRRVAALFLCLTALVAAQDINCTNYQRDGVCTKDAIPYCLTNGTMVFGSCDVRRAVCAERQTVDTTSAACSSSQEIDCSQYNPNLCRRDAISYCLANGTIVMGTCSAQRAVCVERQQIDRDFSSCNKMPNKGMEESLDCGSYRPNGICTLDAIRFCLTNGTVVMGRCDVRRAVCAEKQMIDETFERCNRGYRSNINCQGYNPLVCPRDAITFCLTNGTVLQGSCYARRAVCVENQQIDEDFSACSEAARRSLNRDANSAPAATTGLSLLLTALCMSVWL